jgi:hypothetical protein
MATISKKEAEYIDAAPDYNQRCYICTMFRAPSSCTLVKGKILPAGHCKHFEFDKRFSIDEASEPAVSKGVMTVSNLQMFLPITKIDAVNRLVYAIATEELPDRSGEIFDYGKSKPYYQAWSDAIAKSTGGKSLGNVRAMHTKIAAGKLTELNFNDGLKRIEICAKIVDDAEWNKCVEGVYTGVSQGGSYVDRYPDPANPKLTRYVANPHEISLVDFPCLPTATFQMIKSVGAVSEVEVRKFKNAAPNEDEFTDLYNQALEKYNKSQAEQEAAEGPTEIAVIVDSVDYAVLVPQMLGENCKVTPTPETPALLEKILMAALTKHQPGREAAVGRDELPKPMTNRVEGADTPEEEEPAHAMPTMVDNMEDNEEVEGTAHEHEPGTKEGNPTGQGSFGSEMGRQGKEGKEGAAGAAGLTESTAVGLSATEAAAILKATEESLGASRVPGDDTRQVWLAKDSKPFTKKADAIAHNEELDRQALVKEVAKPVQSVVDRLKGALDRIDGGEVVIDDPQTFGWVWEKMLAGAQARGGVQNLGKVYATTNELPPAVKEHFKSDKKLRQWMKIWNSVYAKTKNEQQAFAQAWSATQKITEDDLDKKAGTSPYGDVDYADPGYQKDSKKRYPVDNEKHIKAAWSYIHMPKNAGKYSGSHLMAIKNSIAAAWKEKIDKDGPPAMGKVMGAELIKVLGQCLSKHLYDVGQVASVILQLNDLKQCLAMEAVREGDSGELADELEIHVANLCQFLRSLVEEETAELVAGTEDLTGHEEEGDNALIVLARAACGPNAAYLADTFRKAGIGLPASEKNQNPKKSFKWVEALKKVGQKMGQVNRMHLQSAHDHIASIDGDACGGMGKAGAALSAATKQHLKTIHDGMSDLGADCTMSKGIMLRATDEEIHFFEKGSGMQKGGLASIVEENTITKRALATVLEQVDVLTKRVEILAKTPEPTRGVKRLLSNVRVVDKSEDGKLEFAKGTPQPPSGSEKEALARYLDTLDPRDREMALQLELIKITQRNPTFVTNN